ncbi:MAG TPA: immunoglobulin-like domain-containing protein, partial [Syntrophomonadaceae bacterium]|nr:immunoglobulin-like domain-containing protein [Syntrophomonadaceae bacterium]
MKRYLCLLVCIIMSFTLLIGCADNDNINLTKELIKHIKQDNSTQSTETIELEPTINETLNNLDGVQMTVKDGTVSRTGLTVVFKNESVDQLIFGEHFLLEKKINEKWYQVPVTIDGDYGFNDIGYDLPLGESKDLEVDWGWLYSSLDNGEYR